MTRYKPDLTGETLWAWANRWRERERARAEAEGRETRLMNPTMRAAAKHFRCTLDEIESAADDSVDGDRYLGIAVGLRVGSGVGVFESRGDYLVEAY